MDSSIKVKVISPNVTYNKEYIHSNYNHTFTKVIHPLNNEEHEMTIQVIPTTLKFQIETKIAKPKLGLMIVGLGGNNGTTLTGMLLANKYKMNWHTRTGIQFPNFFGSVSQIGTLPIGFDERGQEIYVQIKELIPMIDPLDLEIDGWDISRMNLGDANERAAVFEWDLQKKLYPLMEKMVPRPAVFSQKFVAKNQAERADNLIEGTKIEQLQQLREDIRDFKQKKGLDMVIVLWVGNTECFVDIIPGLNDTWKNLENAVLNDSDEISPSTLYALASVHENCPFINGSPQNSLVPGLIEYAKIKGVQVTGNDLKTGQTKLKSALVDYLVGAGLRPDSIVSYNHLGNNDGKNLSAPHTFRSKEISKSGVANDMIHMNPTLFSNASMDHLIVIKYVPTVGDSKRAMDEYVSSIAMGGKNTMVIHNTCEDSLLAAPIMLDLVLFTELLTRMNVQCNGINVNLDLGGILGYWLKAPISSVPHSLFRQRSCIENLIKAAISLPPTSHLHFQSIEQELYNFTNNQVNEHQ